MPNDACKSHLQIHGKEGLNILRGKIRTQGVPVLWNGAGKLQFRLIYRSLSLVLTYNYLQENIPKWGDNRDMLRSMARFFHSSISDTVSIP